MSPEVRRWVVPFGVVGAVTVAIMVAMSMGGTATPEERGLDVQLVEAEMACQDFVSDRLRSPSSAEFSAMIVDGLGPAFTVTGSVDAQNGFGAMLRSDFTCEVEDVAGSWQLLSLTGLE